MALAQHKCSHADLAIFPANLGLQGSCLPVNCFLGRCFAICLGSRVLSRILFWTDVGIEYEPDQRHAEIVILDLGLESAKVKKFSTPGAKEDLNKASTPE